jgi:hypothetical protein
MKDFKEVVRLKAIPTTFKFRCTLCNHEIVEYDWHFGLIKMNQHIVSDHPGEVQALDMEDLYSRKPTISLDSF